MTGRPGSAAGTGPLRRLAERRLRKRPPAEAGGGVQADAQRMLHELQVHQIELELQNEELKQAKAEVETGLQKYTDLYDFAPVGYFSLDEQGLILDVNMTGAALLGVDRSGVTGRRFQLFVAPGSRPAFNALLESACAVHERQTCEVSLLTSNRPAFWADLQAISVVPQDGGRKSCRVAVVDVSARKQAEEAQRRIDALAATNRKLEMEIAQRRAAEEALRRSEQNAHRLLEKSHRLHGKLREISHQLLTAQETQRREISRELHDKISQLLIGINVQLLAFAESAKSNPTEIRRKIVPLRRLVEESVRTVHKFARDLRPAMLDDLGLIPALRAFVHDMARQGHLEIQFAAYLGVEAMDNVKKTMLFRIAQEALANVAKHARARKVKVVILKSRGGVCLEIADDGKAFDIGLISSAAWDNRLGLTGMRERVEMIGGRFTILSAPGKGTTIRAEVPFGK
jgi:PAS domain S-box-containing protein